MEIVAAKVHVRQFSIGHLDTLGVKVLVEFGTDLQAGFCRRCPDQLDNRLDRAQRLTAPVLGDERE